MSSAPRRPERAPPLALTSTRSSSAVRPSCRRFLPRPGRSSSPRRGCGRSTWTRSSPPAINPCREQERPNQDPLTPAPVFIESPRRGGQHVRGQLGEGRPAGRVVRVAGGGGGQQRHDLVGGGLLPVTGYPLTDHGLHQPVQLEAAGGAAGQ